jgi:hypothetical protein
MHHREVAAPRHHPEKAVDRLRGALHNISST